MNRWTAGHFDQDSSILWTPYKILDLLLPVTNVSAKLSFEFLHLMSFAIKKKSFYFENIYMYIDINWCIDWHILKMQLLPKSTASSDPLAEVQQNATFRRVRVTFTPWLTSFWSDAITDNSTNNSKSEAHNVPLYRPDNATPTKSFGKLLHTNAHISARPPADAKCCVNGRPQMCAIKVQHSVAYDVQLRWCSVAMQELSGSQLRL